jgi:hypothetical protein
MGVCAGLPVSDRGHCKDANTVYKIFFFYCVYFCTIHTIGNFGKRGKVKRKRMETGRIRLLDENFKRKKRRRKKLNNTMPG